MRGGERSLTKPASATRSYPPFAHFFQVVPLPPPVGVVLTATTLPAWARYGPSMCARQIRSRPTWRGQRFINMTLLSLPSRAIVRETVRPEVKGTWHEECWEGDEEIRDVHAVLDGAGRDSDPGRRRRSAVVQQGRPPRTEKLRTSLVPRRWRLICDRGKRDRSWSGCRFHLLTVL